MRQALGSIAGVMVLLALAGCGGHHTSQPKGEGIPILFPAPQRGVEADTPEAVAKLIVQMQRAAQERLQRAARLTPSTADGCVPFTDVSGKSSLGPPAPDVRARIIGHQVEVLLRYRSLPDADDCRPAVVTAAVYAGTPGTSSYDALGGIANYAVDGPVGRGLIDLPWGTHGPYSLLVESTTAVGMRGETRTLRLACPAGGCLAGYQPKLHSFPPPKPVLPIVGLTRLQLQTSLREVSAGEQWPSATTAECSSLHACTVTLVTPGFPKQPYRVRFEMFGQQVSGCWLGWYSGAIDPFPYPDAGTGPLELAGCLHWLRG